MTGVMSRMAFVTWGRSTIEKELGTLRAVAAERGAEAGLHELSAASFRDVVQAQMMVLSRRLHNRRTAHSASLATILAELAVDRRQLIAEIEVIQCRGGLSGLRASAGPTWRSAINIMLAVAVLGFSLEAAGLTLGWRLWATAGLAGAMLAINLTVLPVVIRQSMTVLRDFRTHGRRRKQLRRLDARIRRIRKHQETGRQREDSLARWVEEQTAVLLAEYHLQRDRGTAARGRSQVVAT